MQQHDNYNASCSTCNFATIFITATLHRHSTFKRTPKESHVCPEISWGCLDTTPSGYASLVVRACPPSTSVLGSLSIVSRASVATYFAESETSPFVVSQNITHIPPCNHRDETIYKTQRCSAGSLFSVANPVTLVTTISKRAFN